MKKFKSLTKAIICVLVIFTMQSLLANQKTQPVPQENIINQIIEVCKHNSVSEEEVGYPYGKATDECLDTVASLCEEAGLHTTKTQEYVYADYNEGANGESDTVGILGHIDIVPYDAGDDAEDWIVCPFFGDNHRITKLDGEDVLIGRGVLDDKGPMIICLNALREMKEEGKELNNNVRLIFGPDEETGGWRGIANYIEDNGKPRIGFSPDNDFPVCNKEAGMLHIILTADDSNNIIYGGKGRTFVPETAYYEGTPEEIQMIKDEADKLAPLIKYKDDFSIETDNGKITINTKEAKSTDPQDGDNAIVFLAQAMKSAGFTSASITYITEVFPTWKGEVLMEGKYYGHHFTCNVAIADIDENGNQYFELDIKTPWDIHGSAAETLEAVQESAVKYNHKVENPIYMDELYIEDDNRLVVALMESYIEITGDEGAQTMASTGSTYSKAMHEKDVSDFVSFGPYFDGVHLIHMANERMTIANMELTYNIYYDAIEKLANMPLLAVTKDTTINI